MDFDAFLKEFGAHLRRARWAKGLSQEALATDVLTFRLVAELERGRGNPTLRTLFLLAAKLGVRVADLVDVQDDVPRVVISELAIRKPKRGRKASPKRLTPKAPRKRSE